MSVAATPRTRTLNLHLEQPGKPIPQRSIPFGPPQTRSANGEIGFDPRTNQFRIPNKLSAAYKEGGFKPSVLLPTRPEGLGGMPLQVLISEQGGAKALANDLAERINTHGYGFSDRSDFWREIVAVVPAKAGKAGKDEAVIVQVIDVRALVEANYQQQGELGLTVTAAPFEKSGVTIRQDNPHRWQISVPSGEAKVDRVQGRTDAASENLRLSIDLPDGSKLTPESLRGRTALDVAIAICAVINRSEGPLRAAPVAMPGKPTDSEVYVFDAVRLANELSQSRRAPR